MFTQAEIVEILEKRYTKGTRIRLHRMNDPIAPPKGALGTVTGVDDAGHILMKWDTGGSLSLIYGEDVFEPIEMEEEK